MKLIAIDPGSNEMGIMHYRLARPRTLYFSGNRPYRLAQVMLQLDDIFVVDPFIDTVLFERPFARGGPATRCLWGVAGIIEAVATKHGCATLDITPSMLKKWALGKGGGLRNKDPMIALAGVMGYDGLNEHEADALLLYHFGLEHIKSGE